MLPYIPAPWIPWVLGSPISRYPEDEDVQNGEQQLASCWGAEANSRIPQDRLIPLLLHGIPLPTFKGDCWRYIEVLLSIN